MKKYSMELGLLMRFGAVAGVVVVWIIRALMQVGISRYQLLWPQPVVAVLLLVFGWQFGWLLIELDKYLKSFLKGNPQVTEFLVTWSSGVRNIATMSVLVVLGFWLISSSSSIVAWGVVMGVQARILVEFLLTNEYKKWYSVLGRVFNEREHKGVSIVMVGLFLIQVLFIIRG